MKTLKTSVELIIHLENGFGLKKKHYYHNSTQVVGIEFLFYDKEHKYFEGKGWASAGDSESRFIDVMKNPHLWEFAGKIEDREWIKENPI